MKNIVVTGSTRGIGRGLAIEFLKRGCRVMITGRQQPQVDALVAELSGEFDAENIAGTACEVTAPESLQGLWDFTSERFGTVDVWINNAGVSILRQRLSETPSSDLHRIVDTNFAGLLYATKIAIQGMSQQGHGQIWNMEGFGSGGQTASGMAAYGATKRAVNYLTKALQKEVKDSSVQVCSLSPGIVVTDLLTGDYDLASEEWRKAKKILNILGDKVETVTPYLAEQVLSTNKSGATVAWLTGRKAFFRFLTAGFNKRDLFAHLDQP